MDMTKYAGGDGQYLKAADLKGKTREITIKLVGIQAFEKEDGHTDEKPVLWLETKDEQDRGVVLNKTNTRACVDAWTIDSDKWIGKKAMLSVRQTNMGPGLQVTPITSANDLDDDIPF